MTRSSTRLLALALSRQVEKLHELHEARQVGDDDRARLVLRGDAHPGQATQHVADLCMFSHGWGAAQNQAQALYDVMFPMIRNAAQGVPALGTLGFAGIYWPSLWFPPTPATPPQPPSPRPQ